MKCISCEIEINPQWKHAIDMNVCPFCGKHIMEEHLKNLFASLSETMAALQKYPEQLNDWMLSNHDYIKTDSPDIGKHMPEEMLKELRKFEDEKEFQKRKDNQKFTVKVKTDTGEEEVMAEKIQSEEKTNEFFKRAEISLKNPSNQPATQGGAANSGQNFQSLSEKTQYHKAMVQQIKKEGSKGLTVDGRAMGIPAEMLENADPTAVAEFQSMMSGGAEISSSINSDIDDDLPGGDFILQANMAAAAAKTGGGNSGGGANAKDMAHLQRLQSKVSEARRNVLNGSKGFFSRS